MNIIGKIRGKRVIMIDDIIDTAGTITQGAEALCEAGAIEVFACCTHPVLSGPAIRRMAQSSITEVIITNTIYCPTETLGDKITVLSVAKLLGDAIIRIHEDLSVSKLFD
ncbi:MAG: ribose-phosphate diphosphokinase, partial [bacterium]|nr:ribose-phosphate diphosphokinase [bacterium]